MMRIMLDTNIVLDFCNDARRPFHDQAIALVRACMDHAIGVCVAVSSLNDVYYVLRRHYENEESARADIVRLLDVFSIEPLLERHARRSLRSDEPDFEDGLIRAIAESADVEVLVTRDARAFGGSHIRHMDAERCLAYLQRLWT